MFSTPKSLRSTAPKGRSLTEYDSDDEGDDLKEKRRNQKREHEEQSKEGGAGGGDSPLKSFKTQRILVYEDSDDVLGTIAAMKDDGQEEVPPLVEPAAAESPKPLSQPSVIVLDEIEDGEGEPE